ncbi:MAG TPA: type II toxin-antitoxin system VapC family toxin [Rubrobacter sp.]|nr:type II toxin-antitoxin system VapC family toxin [Rubrobacter sp.]
MAERLLIDTDVLVEYLRGRSEAVEYLEGLTSDLYLSVISVAELFAGIKGNEEKKALDQLLQGFIILPVTEKVARLGGLHRRYYRPSHGTGLADALIAATAEENGADLATFNRRHFPMVSRIEVPYER